MANTPTPQLITVAAEFAGTRVDSFLRHVLPELSRAARAELIAAGGVRSDGRALRKGAALQAGERLEIHLAARSSAAPPELAIVYEDADLVAIDKPAGVPSHALRVDERWTIASALLERYPEMTGIGYRPLEAGLLHRLDTETSGILVAARHAASFARMREAHTAGQFEKQYLALVSGRSAPQRSAAFLRADRRKVRVEFEAFAGAKAIVTEVLSVEPRADGSLVCVQVALAGRHQVRAHLARLGHPIAGDQLYGGASLPGLSRHFLHASQLVLPHPADGRRLVLQAALPDDLRAVLDRLPLAAAELSR